MRDFFRGWKRKFGVVTLLMACAFMAGWVRSLTTEEGFEVWHGKYKYGIRSWRNCMRWDHMFVEEGELKESLIEPYSFNSDVETDWTVIDTMVDKVQWQFAAGEVFVGRREGMLGKGSAFVPMNGLPRSFTMFVAMVPYWSITIPLTVLSAYLLLSKPRSTSPKRIHALAPAEGL